MKEEVETGVGFITRLVNRHERLDRRQVERFGERLTAILCERFSKHWYPETPLKGQAYRCIRINRRHPVDDSLLRACRDCGLKYSELWLPREITIWFDPGEVSCRLGENNSFFKVKNEESRSGKSTPETETSDYHSESPSECSSEDEWLTRPPPEASGLSETPLGRRNTQQAAQYFYTPAPIWVPYPPTMVSYVPAYHPLTVYYVNVSSKPPVARKPNPNLVKRLTKRASKA